MCKYSYTLILILLFISTIYKVIHTLLSMYKSSHIPTIHYYLHSNIIAYTLLKHIYIYTLTMVLLVLWSFDVVYKLFIVHISIFV